MCRVLIVDDSPALRRALRCHIERHPELEVCGEADNGQAAIEKFRQLKPDFVILDFSMPVMDGIHAALALKQIMPHAPLILFTALRSRALEIEALAAGIAAVVSKEDPSALVSKAHELVSKAETALAQEKGV